VTAAPTAPSFLDQFPVVEVLDDARPRGRVRVVTGMEQDELLPRLQELLGPRHLRALGLL
jgi:hypothetical protein